MIKILITGANGFLGQNLAIELYKSGFKLRLMIRDGSSSKILEQLNSEVFYGDVTNLNHVDQAVKGCDYVIHTASITEQWGFTKEEYYNVNVRGTMNIVQSCLVHNVKRLIHVSTANTISPGTKLKPGNELKSADPSDLASGYAGSKYIAQQYVSEQIVNKGLPAIIINPTFMIGAGDSKPSSGKLILYGINKKVIFYPPGGKNFVNINDVVVGIIHALSLKTSGDIYLIAGENLTYGEFFDKLNIVSGQDPIMIKIPEAFLVMAGLFGSLKTFFCHTPARLTYQSARSLCLFNFYSNEKSERQLGINYKPVQKAIENAVRWFRQEGYC